MQKVIQIDRVELSTEISHVKKLSRRVIQKLFYPNSMTLFFDIKWHSLIFKNKKWRLLWGRVIYHRNLKAKLMIKALRFATVPHSFF